MKMNAVDVVAYVLVIIGGVNWGLVGAFQFNLVDSLFGVDSALSRIVYTLVGIAALYAIYSTLKLSKGQQSVTSKIGL